MRPSTSKDLTFKCTPWPCPLETNAKHCMHVPMTRGRAGCTGPRGQDLQRRGHAGLACHTCRTAPSRSAVHVLPHQRTRKEQAQEQNSLHSGRKIKRGRQCQAGRMHGPHQLQCRSAGVRGGRLHPGDHSARTRCCGAPLAWLTPFHDAGGQERGFPATAPLILHTKTIRFERKHEARRI